MGFRIPRTAESLPSPGPSGPGPGPRVPVPRPGPARPPPALAYLVKAYFDGFPVEHAVPAVDSLPRADGAQLGRGDRGLDGEAVEVLAVIVGYESGGGRRRRSVLWRGLGGRRLPVTSRAAGRQKSRWPGTHDDEAEVSRIFRVVRGLVAAYRPSLWRR